MSSLHSVNGVNRSHNPCPMGDASFKSHVTTSTRDLPMIELHSNTADMFNRYTCFIVWHCDMESLRIGGCFSFIQKPRIVLRILCPRCSPGVQRILTLLPLGMLTRKTYGIVDLLSYSVFIVGWAYWMGVMADTRHWYQARKPCMASWVRVIYSPQSKHCPLTSLSIIQ